MSGSDSVPIVHGMNTATRMRHIPTTVDRYGDGLESATIRVENLVRTHFPMCSIGIVPVGKSGRRVFGGPQVPGPWGYAVTHANVIDNSGMAARERRDAIVFRVGEPFTVAGLPGVWTFASPRRGHLDGDGARLVPFAEGVE